MQVKDNFSTIVCCVIRGIMSTINEMKLQLVSDHVLSLSLSSGLLRRHLPEWRRRRNNRRSWPHSRDEQTYKEPWPLSPTLWSPVPESKKQGFFLMSPDRTSEISQWIRSQRKAGFSIRQTFLIRKLYYTEIGYLQPSLQWKCLS